MATLDEILKSPNRATITENLLVAADPFGEIDNIPVETRSAIMQNISRALESKFSDGQKLVEFFIDDVLSLEYVKDPYQHMDSVKTAFDAMNAFLDRKPAMLDQRLQKFWRIQKEKGQIDPSKDSTAIDPRRYGITADELLEFQLSYYTHQHKHTRKEPKLPSPFSGLQTVSYEDVTIHLRSQPNVAYPHYEILGFQYRIKNRRRIIRKIILKTFEAMEELQAQKRFGAPMGTPTMAYLLSRGFGTDYFGVKIIGLTPLVNKKVAGLVYHPSTIWNVQPQEKKNGLNIDELLLTLKGSESEGTLQVQNTTLAGYMLDDFVGPNNRNIKTVRREQKVQEYQKKYPALYKRMFENMEEVLGFLPDINMWSYDAAGASLAKNRHINAIAVGRNNP